MNVHQYRLIFSDIKQLSHADTEYIDIQQYAMNENKKSGQSYAVSSTALVS